MKDNDLHKLLIILAKKLKNDENIIKTKLKPNKNNKP